VSIGGQSVDAGRAAMLNQIYGLSCSTAQGQVLTVQGGTASCVYSVPQHTIAAFDTPCPPGWTAFAAGAGRFLVGTGSDGLPHSNGQLYTYGLGESGGNAAVTLVLGNLPLNFPNTGSNANSGNKAEPGTTLPAPINVLPPYTAVNWCQKS
jgi:hypothetical protein